MASSPPCFQSVKVVWLPSREPTRVWTQGGAGLVVSGAASWAQADIEKKKMMQITFFIKASIHSKTGMLLMCKTISHCGTEITK